MIATQTDEDIVAVEPPPYVVIFFDDDVTTFGFVIDCLIKHFDYHLLDADEMAHNIDTVGKAVVATLPHAIAEQRAFAVKLDAIAQCFPLRVVIEPEY